MNLEAVLSAVNQSTAPQTPGATAAQQSVNGNGNGTFKQMLTAMVQQADQPLNGASQGTVATNQQADWLNMLINIFGQDPDSGMLSLDPTGEAALPADTAVSLTEVMAALQTMATQENLTDLANTAVANITPEQLETLLKDQDPATNLDPDTINALLAMIGAPAADTPLPTSLPQLLQQLQAITNAEQASPQAGQSLPNPDLASAQTVAQTTNAASTPATATNFQSTLTAESTRPATTSPAPIAATATAATQTYSAPPTAPVTTNVETVTTSATSAQTATANLSQTETTTNPQSQPTTTIPLPDSSISAPATSAPAAATFAVPESTPAATTSATLPDIPALHQIVKSIELLTHNDKNAVRLQLHPESLGQILVHLDHSDGNITVRMLAETVQAQNLVQEHLPQLRQAFTAQGLQTNNLSVAVGSDASAFDAPNNPAQQGFQGTFQQSFAPNLDRGEQNSSLSSITRSGSSLHTVDYQV